MVATALELPAFPLLRHRAVRVLAVCLLLGLTEDVLLRGIG
jgi:hypothetical protein